MRQALTTEQVATLLQVSPEHVRRLARTGRLRGARLGTAGWRFSEEQVKAYLDSETVHHGEEPAP
jgi:excisionase family DNA binding protein